MEDPDTTETGNLYTDRQELQHNGAEKRNETGTVAQM
jgi:hypothetical protein